MNLSTDAPLTALKGVGSKTAENFAKLNITTIGELLLYYPRDYIRFPQIRDIDEFDQFDSGATYAIHAILHRGPVVRQTRRMPVTLLAIGSPGHRIQLIWYRMPYLASTLKAGSHMIFYGKVSIKDQHYCMEQPAVYTPEQYEELEDSLQPVYALTAGVNNKLLTRTMKKALDSDLLYPEYLPDEIRRSRALSEYNYALKEIHFPDDMDALIRARKRLVYDEFFLFILGIQYRKERKIRETNPFSFLHPEFVKEQLTRLPYPLTDAQLRVLEEIQRDMTGPYVTERLIQGDVGSGKTILAFLLMAWVSANGFQSAIMAPTEVLARQHYETYKKTCEMLGLRIPLVLLTGSMTARQKRNAYERLQLFPNAMVIGTHALIQERTDYLDLALVITDEQHRFGVRQREALAGKGVSPHILVMSATPIPRTLAIILYGDMDISVIDQVPVRRLPIKNAVVGVSYRPKAYDFIQKQIEAGHQAYIICPFVEASENMEGENVTDYAERIADQFPDEIHIGVLHGKMKAEKKDEVMTAFSENRIQILVSTTVVEVGVNVPNATVMMIENADRFGLAQLHQLRGRVGRGDAQSYCIMINSSNTKTAARRLDTLNRSNDGFFIASEDLKLRGPGDFFGIRQSGDMAFELGDIYQDADILQQVSEDVADVLKTDPDLTYERHRLLRHKLESYLEGDRSRLNL